MKNIKLAAWFLRVGLAFVFAYASIEMCINPQNFLKYTPTFIFNIFPETAFLYSFGLAEFLLAIWLLTKWKSEYSSILSVMLMIGIIAFNPEHFQVLFRNVAIAFGGLALLMLETNQKASDDILLAGVK
jgi:uncharacterized membrane protein YphA (DoxX/SURF4 family)